MAQGCSLSPILFSVFTNGLLKDVEDAGLGIEISSGKRMGGMLFADDFVGVSEKRESLQKLIDVVYRYCNRWRLKANVGKSAVMVFSMNKIKIIKSTQHIDTVNRLTLSRDVSRMDIEHIFHAQQQWPSTTATWEGSTRMTSCGSTTT